MVNQTALNDTVHYNPHMHLVCSFLVFCFLPVESAPFELSQWAAWQKIRGQHKLSIYSVPPACLSQQPVLQSVPAPQGQLSLDCTPSPLTTVSTVVGRAEGASTSFFPLVLSNSFIKACSPELPKCNSASSRTLINNTNSSLKRQPVSCEVELIIHSTFSKWILWKNIALGGMIQKKYFISIMKQLY